MTENKDEVFSIKDLYPKEVCDREGNKETFNAKKILESLKNVGLDEKNTKKILEEVIRKIIGFGIDIISTDTIREIINKILLEKGILISDDILELKKN